MPQMLSLSRAARLVNVSRGQLQARIRELNIETFEGKVSSEDLLEAYPALNLQHDAVFERAQNIKANARPKSKYSDNWTPDPDVLMARLHDFRHVLARTKSTVNSMETLLAQVTAELQEMTHMDGDDLQNAVLKLYQRLQQSLQKAQTKTDRKAELFARDAILRFIAVSARLVPSGHEFFVEGKDSLLEAALKAGLHLNYGCASGNCGKCKVRVLKGEVSRIREHDYLLSALEQDQGYCLACSNTAVSDVVLEAAEAVTAADLPIQEIRCRVKNIEAVTDTLHLLSVQTPRTKTLRFMAGQYVSMTLENGQQRNLAVASCPCDGLNLQFLFKRLQQDRFIETLQQGDEDQTVLIEGPQGDFLLDEASLEPVIFVAVDEGFAAIKSLVEHTIAIDNAIGMYLYRVDDEPSGSLLSNLCRSWDDALDNFFYRRLEINATPDDTLAIIAATAGNLSRQRFYVAGPGSWIERFLALTHKQGVPADQVRTFKLENT